MIFKWRKSTMKSDPVFGLAELQRPRGGTPSFALR
jgi:hypothetical protein